MACTDIASGVRVSMGIIEEVTCGVTPPGIAANYIAGDVVPAVPSVGYFQLTATSGDFTVGGFLPGQVIEISGATNDENNGFWRIHAVDSNTLITLVDPDAEAATESASALAARIAYEGLRATERNVNLEIDTIESAEVRKDRQYADVRNGFNQVVGDVGYELSLVSYDSMIQFAMARRLEPVTIAAFGALTVTAGTPGDFNATITRSTGSFEDDGIRKGSILRTEGATAGSPNNRNWIVLNVVSDTEILVSNPREDVNGDVPTTISFPGRRIDIGQELITATMQRAFNDIPSYQVYRGVTVNSMSWTLAAGEPVGGAFSMLGMSSAPLASTPLTEESLQPETPFMSAFDGQLYEDGNFNAVVTSMEFTLENQRQLQPVVGNNFSPGVFEGRCSITGTIQAFFRGGPLYNRFINEQDAVLTMLMNNAGASQTNDAVQAAIGPGGGDEFISVTFPRVKYTGAVMNPPSEGPVVMEMPFRSLATKQNQGVGELEVSTSMTIQVSNLHSDERDLLE